MTAGATGEADNAKGNSQHLDIKKGVVNFVFLNTKKKKKKEKKRNNPNLCDILCWNDGIAHIPASWSWCQNGAWRKVGEVGLDLW